MGARLKESDVVDWEKDTEKGQNKGVFERSQNRSEEKTQEIGVNEKDGCRTDWRIGRKW